MEVHKRVSKFLLLCGNILSETQEVSRQARSSGKKKWLLTSRDRADREAEAARRARPGPTKLAHRMDVPSEQTEVKTVSNIFVS